MEKTFRSTLKNTKTFSYTYGYENRYLLNFFLHFCKFYLHRISHVTRCKQTGPCRLLQFINWVEVELGRWTHRFRRYIPTRCWPLSPVWLERCVESSRWNRLRCVLSVRDAWQVTAQESVVGSWLRASVRVGSALYDGLRRRSRRRRRRARRREALPHARAPPGHCARAAAAPPASPPSTLWLSIYSIVIIPIYSSSAILINDNDKEWLS